MVMIKACVRSEFARKRLAEMQTLSPHFRFRWRPRTRAKPQDLSSGAAFSPACRVCFWSTLITLSGRHKGKFTLDLLRRHQGIFTPLFFQMSPAPGAHFDSFAQPPADFVRLTSLSPSRGARCCFQRDLAKGSLTETLQRGVFHTFC